MNKKITLFIFALFFLIVSTSVVSAACVDLDDSGTWGTAVTENVAGNGYLITESITLCQDNYSYSLNAYYSVLNAFAGDIVIDLNGSKIVGTSGTQTGGVDIASGNSNVTVKNGIFQNTYFGADVADTFSSIINCTFEGVSIGLRIADSADNNVFTDLFIDHPIQYGFDISGENNEFYNNTVLSASSGQGSVWLYEASGNYFEGNNISDGQRGFNLFAGSSDNNYFYNNYIYSSSSWGFISGNNNNLTLINNTFDSNVDGLYLSISENSLIENNTFINGLSEVIQLSECTDITVNNNYLSNNQRGIELQSTTDSSVTNNYISEGERGLDLGADSTNALISDNVFCGNSVFDVRLASSATFTDGGNNKAGLVVDQGTVSSYSFDDCTGVCLPSPGCYGVFGSTPAGTTGYTVSYSPATYGGEDFDQNVAFLYVDGGLELERITNNYSVTPGVIDGTHDWYILVFNQPGLSEYATFYARDDSGLTTCAAAAALGVTNCYVDSPTPVFEANGDGTFTVNDVYNVSATGYDPVILYYGPQVNPLTGYSLNNGVSCYSDSSCSTTETFPEYTIGGGEEPGDDNETEETGDIYTDEIFIGYADSGDELSVNYFYEYGWTGPELEGASSGGDYTPTSAGGSTVPEETTFVIGDGVCDSDLGETILRSPVDCRPSIDEDEFPWWTVLIIVFLFMIYYAYRQNKRGY